MGRIRLNSEYRNKGGVRFREHLEQENTQEKEAYLQARENIIPLQKDTWKLAETIVRRHYTDEDVKMAYHLKISLIMFQRLRKIVVFILVINLKIKKMMTMIRTTKQLRNILISD